MNTQDLALLTTRLYLPLVIREILESPASLSDDMHYSLHTVLSDYRPDSALLAIALSAQEILTAEKTADARTRLLGTACEKALADYAANWMATFSDKTASEAALLDVFEDVAGDLETLSGLLEAVCTSLKDEKSVALLKILKVQAKAQSVIANEFVSLMDCEFMQGPAHPVSYAEISDEEDEFSDLDLEISCFGPAKKVVRCAAEA